MGEENTALKRQEKEGKATFIVQVQFRQNATWQGMISWTDHKKTQHFRSALEMIRLMDDALNTMAGELNEDETEWENPEE